MLQWKQFATNTLMAQFQSGDKTKVLLKMFLAFWGKESFVLHAVCPMAWDVICSSCCSYWLEQLGSSIWPCFFVLTAAVGRFERDSTLYVEFSFTSR